MDQKSNSFMEPADKARETSANEIGARLISISDMLTSLSRSSEQQFLEIGGRLNEYLGISRILEEQSLEVIEKLSGQGAVAAIGDLHGLYDRIKQT